jgi:transcriptional regulator with XRE-family HTH domain
MAKGKAGEHDKRTGRFLSDCRSEVGLTQTALAHVLNVRQQQICRYEAGKTRISRDALTELAPLFGYRPDAFLAKITKLGERPGGLAEGEPEPFVHQAEPSETDGDALPRFATDLARLSDPEGFRHLRAHLDALLRRQKRRKRPGDEERPPEAN